MESLRKHGVGWAVCSWLVVACLLGCSARPESSAGVLAETEPDPSSTPAVLPPPLAQDLAGGTEPLWRVLEETLVDGIPQAEVLYQSDGLDVRGFFFLPKGKGVHPGVVLNHGGVNGVSEDMKRRSRDLARLGYAVVAPTYRGEGGSEGVVEVARGEVTDVLVAAELLSRHPRVDGSRLAVAGSSHGALVSILAAAREPDRFRCIVEACGVMDVVSWYRYLVENDFDVSDSLSVAVYGHGPEDKPESFRIRQAVRVADRIGSPLLIQHGVLDRTVPVEQARQFRDAVRDTGHLDVRLEEYPLLGHAFWFWNDIRYHTEEEIAEAEAAWSNFTMFLEEHLHP